MTRDAVAMENAATSWSGLYSCNMAPVRGITSINLPPFDSNYKYEFPK